MSNESAKFEEILYALKDRLSELSAEVTNPKTRKARKEAIRSELQITRLNFEAMLALSADRYVKTLDEIKALCTSVEENLDSVRNTIVKADRKTRKSIVPVSQPVSKKKYSYPEVNRDGKKGHVVRRAPEYKTTNPEPVDRSSCCDSPIATAKNGTISWCVACNTEVLTHIRKAR